jgi:4-hydroxybenzoate polyprenyltransferase
MASESIIAVVAPSSRPVAGREVVVVDLDNSLLKGDSLHEQAIRMLFHRPELLPGLVKSFFGGRTAVKAYCAEHVVLDPETLHICDEVLAYLRDEKAKGSFVVLCTAADLRTAQGIADHLGLFDEVIASSDGINLKGAVKARRLRERFPQGFVYAGDHATDLAVWAEAKGIVLVGASDTVRRKAHRLGKPVLAELRLRASRPKPFTTWRRALRVHHWSKNILIFVPLILGHRWTDWPLVAQTALGFALLLAVTSSGYLINDLADLDADRRHATKRMRPIAAGQISPFKAMAVAAILLPLSLVVAFLLNPWFGAAILGYTTLTFGYSFGLKRVPLFDTFVIAGLFTLRLLMGAALMGQPLPVWLVTFSMFFFFSLATAKRHGEVVAAGRGGSVSLGARGYEPNDWPLTLTYGIGAGLGSLVILVLYLVDEAFKVVGYTRPEFLWLISLVIAVWIGRIWLLTQRGKMRDDPVSFALRDRWSLGLAALALVFFAVAV